jgi:hypothetical protein
MESETVPDQVSAKAATANREPSELINKSFLMRTSPCRGYAYSTPAAKKDFIVCGGVF